MKSSVTREAVEQQFLAAAAHACSAKSYTLLRAELGIVESEYTKRPSPKKLAAVNDLRRRVKLAHRALFRVVE